MFSKKSAKSNRPDRFPVIPQNLVRDDPRGEAFGASVRATPATIPRMSKKRDRELGMHRPITRRDFIGGVAVGLGGAAWAAGCGPGQPPLPPDPGFERAADYYPPGKVGLRGSHDGSFEAAHRLKDGRMSLDGAVDLGETYDLVVVGGGISGLAAAHYLPQQARPDARVLVLDNHDDFGGHAKRNEFTHDGRTYIGYGGTQSIDSPAPYCAMAKGLITELGIDVASYERVLDGNLYKSLGLSGAHVLRQGDLRRRQARGRRLAQPDEEFLAQSPLEREGAGADLCGW